MAFSCMLNIKIGDEADSHAISCSGSDQEEAALRAFLFELKRLKALPIVQAGIPATLNISFSVGDPPVVSGQLPDEADLSALLHRLRPLILESEPTSFKRISAMVRDLAPSPQVQKLLKQQNHIYNGRSFQHLLKVESGGKVINSESVLKLWLNAEEYHRDSDKKAILNRLSGILPKQAHRTLFVFLLGEQIQALQQLAEFVELILGDRNGITR